MLWFYKTVSQEYGNNHSMPHPCGDGAAKYKGQKASFKQSHLIKECDTSMRLGNIYTTYKWKQLFTIGNIHWINKG